MENDYVTKADAAAIKMEILERVEKVETTLLKEFRKWARSMGLIEERVSELENPS